GFLVLVAGDAVLAFDDAKALAPTADIGRIGGAVREAARRGMVVPGPARGVIDLEAHPAAEAARRDTRAVVVGACADGFGSIKENRLRPSLRKQGSRASDRTLQPWILAFAGITERRRGREQMSNLTPQCASGSGLIWILIARGRFAVPPSRWNIVRVP